MRTYIAVVVFLAVSSGCAAQDAFHEARELARQIISVELEGQFCKPSPIPELQRWAMTNALARIDRSGLSDPTGLSPLNLAVISDDLPTIKRLNSLGYARDSPDSSLLHDAVLHDSKRVLSDDPVASANAAAEFLRSRGFEATVVLEVEPGLPIAFLVTNATSGTVLNFRKHLIHLPRPQPVRTNRG